MQTTKCVEYWIHMEDNREEAEVEDVLDILCGREWRKAKKIAANPPDNVFLVERVVRWGNDADGVTDTEYTVLFERYSL